MISIILAMLIGAIVGASALMIALVCVLDSKERGWKNGKH